MKLRKFLISSVGFFTLSFAGEVDQFLENLGVSLSSGSSIDAQVRGYYFGGGASYRAPSATLQPFQIVPPSINAGCGGIDIAFGSFSYLKPEYFIDFAKKTISAAPGFAFDIALDIMCPQCSSIMKKLTALANQINAMSMSSCQLLANLSNRIKSEIVNNKVAGGGSDSWLDAVNSTLDSWSNAIGEFNTYLSNLGCSNPDCYLFAGYRSIADRFADEVSSTYPYWNTTSLKFFIRALFGDVIRRGSSTPYEYVCIDPSVSVYDILKLAEGQPGTPLVELPGYNDNGEFATAYLQNVRKYVHDQLDSIITKIINREPLSSSDLEFLARYDIPALGILRMFAPSPSALRAVQSDLERYLAYELTYQFIAGLTVEYTKVINKARNLMRETPDMDENKKELVDCIRWRLNTEYARDFLQRLWVETNKRKESLAQRIRFALDLYEMERFVYSKFSRHPLMSSYMFGRLMK